MTLRHVLHICLFALAFWLPSVWAQNTLYLHSQQGDYVGAGTTRTLVTPGWVFSSAGSASYVSLQLRNSTSGGWDVELAGPNGSMLTPGTYENARQFPASGSSNPRLRVSGDGRGCSGSTGRFTVHEISFVGAALNTLAVDFEQSCDGSLSKLYGQLRFFSSYPIDTVRRNPQPFTFPGVFNATSGSSYVSATATISGVDISLPISVTGGEMSIDYSPFSAAATTVSAGQTVRVRGVAPMAANAVQVVTLNVGSFSTAFEIASPPGQNPQPNGDPLIVLVGYPKSGANPTVTRLMSPAANNDFVLRKSLYNSGNGRAEVFVSTAGISQSYSVTFGGPNFTLLTPGTYSGARQYTVADEAHFSTSGFDYPTCSGGSNATTRFVVHEANYLPDGTPTSLAVDFVSQCADEYSNFEYVFGFVRMGNSRAIDYSINVPRAFSITPVVNAAIGTLVDSELVTPAGFNVPIPVNISNGSYSIAGGPFTSAPGTLNPGQSLRVRLLSAPQSNQVRVADLNVGGRLVNFKVGTDPGATPQPDGSDLVVIKTLASTNVPATTVVFSAASMASLSRQYGSFNPGVLANIAGATGVNWNATFDGPGGATLSPGNYTGWSGSGSQAYFSSGGSSSLNCNFARAFVKFTVHEVEYSVSGETIRFAADFEEICTPQTYSYSPSAVYGYVRLNSNIPIEYAFRRPDAFAFAPALGVAPSSMSISNEVTISGINVAVPVSISQGEYSINDGPFTSVQGSILAGQRIRVRAPAPTQANELREITLSVGDGSAVYIIATAPGINPQPNGRPLAVFYSQGDDAIGNGLTSIHSPATQAAITASLNYNRAITFNINYPQASNLSPWTLVFMAANGTLLQPGTYASAGSYSTAFLPGLSITQNMSFFCGTTSGSFNVLEVGYSADQSSLLIFAADFSIQCSSRAFPLIGHIRFNSSLPISPFVDTVPAPVAFSGLQNQARSVWAASAAVTVGSMNAPAQISVAGGEYSINDGPFTNQNGTISAGSSLRLRVLTSSAYGETRTTSVNVGGLIAQFSAQTEFSDSTPNFINLGEFLRVPRATYVLSNLVTISGINTAATVTIQGGEFSIGGRPFTSSPSAVLNGETLQVRVMSSSAYGDYRLAIITIGSLTQQFATRTLGQFTLTLATAGSGSGVIAGATPAVPGTNSCPGSCMHTLEEGTAITLAATSAAGSAFGGWSGVNCAAGNALTTCSFTLSANTTATANFDSSLSVVNDFNDDAKSDLLWRNSVDGAVQGWLMNGLSATQVAGLLPAGGYTVTHVADLDGNGKADTLIRHGDGTTIGWLHDGLGVIDQATFFAAGSGWSVRHSADLNGDGKADLIVEHTDGRVVGWLMNGLAVTGTATFVGAGSGWYVTRAGDLNGDGKADLIWQHAGGTVQAWLMDGLSVSQAATFVGAGTGWSVKLMGDFNGDGKADLVWQNTDGTVQAWLMDGLAISQIASFVPAGTGWSPVLAGDIDGDGKADLFWEHTDGRSQTWLMNGLSVTNLAGFVGAGGWKATHLLDLNGDGKKDVLWKHSDGTVQAWLLNGLSILQVAGLAGAGSFEVIPPRP